MMTLKNLCYTLALLGCSRLDLDIGQEKSLSLKGNHVETTVRGGGLKGGALDGEQIGQEFMSWLVHYSAPADKLLNS